MTFLAVLPSIYPPYTERCLAGMHPDFLEHVMVVDNTAINRGVARSWNLGARLVLADSLDWLVSISAATRFGPSGGMDFVAELDNLSSVVEAQDPVGWHLIGWSRGLLTRIGLFDENYLAYGEDMDWSWRAILDGGLWRNVPVDAWLAMQGHGTQLAGVVVDHKAQDEYTTRKWGPPEQRFRPHGGSWIHPFNDPANPLSYWPEPLTY